MTDAATLLDRATTVVLVHAHPDDETLSTGGLIAELVARGKRVAVLTATRGEMGEVVPGSLERVLTGRELADHRETEVEGACRTLGVTDGAFLGDLPARAPHARPRRYTDSGMVWLDEAETLAGPGPDAGPDALSLAHPGEVAADIAAYAEHLGADLLVSYDEFGGYGHPDHVALNDPTREAADALGIGFLEVVSHPEPGSDAVDAVTVETPQHLDVVREALRHYATQLTVDGDEVVHVGGQRQPIQLSFTLRPAVEG